MYLTSGRGYYRGTDQHAARGWFLLLLQPKQYRDAPPDADVPRPCKRLDIGATCAAENTYAIVRRVALAQFGHFMMGRVNIGGKWRTVSGSYGNDGLPMDIETLPRDAVALPRELFNAWNKGGGWNSAGSEAPAMRDWARQTFARQIDRQR